MPTFGISAFLKLVCLSQRARRTELRRRLVGSDGAYDYHRNLRLRAKRLLLDGEPIESVLASTATIVKPAERQSTISGIQSLDRWRLEHGQATPATAALLYESPAAIFRVSFGSDFGFLVEGQPTAIHVWNTIRPPLQPHLVRATLTLFEGANEASASPATDLGVLSLRTRELYRLSEAEQYRGLGGDVVHNLEELFVSLRQELGMGQRPEDRPQL